MVPLDVDRGLVVGFLVHFGLSYADDVWFQLIDVGVEQLLGKDRSEAIDVPIANYEFRGGTTLTVVPPVQTRLGIVWNHIDKL